MISNSKFQDIIQRVIELKRRQGDLGAKKPYTFVFLPNQIPSIRAIRLWELYRCKGIPLPKGRCVFVNDIYDLMGLNHNNLIFLTVRLDHNYDLPDDYL